jgi:hypothetical protein
MATKTVLVRQMRAVKKETLKLIQTFVKNCKEADHEAIYSKFLPALLDPVTARCGPMAQNSRSGHVLVVLMVAFPLWPSWLPFLCGPHGRLSFVALISWLPFLCGPQVLDDYKRNVPSARDAEVLLLFSGIVEKVFATRIKRNPHAQPHTRRRLGPHLPSSSLRSSKAW